MSHNPWLIKHSKLLGAYRSIAAFVGFPVVIIGGIYSYTQIMEALAEPEVGLEFVYMNNVAVKTVNLSSVVVYDQKYWFALINIDKFRMQNRNPLSIPAHLGDYIRVGGKTGPHAMMSIAVDKGEVKAGDRIIGFAGVTCPKCKIRYYWLYIKHGEGGWYAEMEDDELINITNIQIGLPSADDVISAYFKDVAEDRKIPIE